MTNTDFTTLKGLFDASATAGNPPSTEGNIYRTTMVTNKTLGTLLLESTPSVPTYGMRPFSRFYCGPVNSPNTEEQVCLKYQLRDFETEWTQGNLRFEASQRVNYYMMNVRGWRAAYALFEGQAILQGGEMLAVGMALAAAVSLSF